MQRRISILLAFLIAFSIPAAAQQNLAKSQKRRDALEKDIAILRRQLDATSSQSEQALSSLSLIQAQKQSRKKLIAESEIRINELTVQANLVQKEYDRQQALLDTLQQHYNRLVLGAYKNRDIKIWYMYILSSENMSQAFRRFGYFKGLSSQIQVQANAVEQAKSDLKKKKAELQAAKAKVQKEKDRRTEEYARLKSDEARQQTLITKLKKNSKAYKASLKAKQEEMKALDKQIARMIAEAAKKQKTTASKKKKPVDTQLAMQFEQNMGKLPWPVDGPVTEHYGAYQNKELKLSLFNNGVTIACDPGSKVQAVFDGVVSNIMIAPGYGQCILIQHGDYYTSYCKVKNATVHQGDKVKTGQVIAEAATIMGKTQLYFLVWKKKYLDPENWLRER